jgi:hypothetical protein
MCEFIQQQFASNDLVCHLLQQKPYPPQWLASFFPMALEQVLWGGHCHQALSEVPQPK